jgi:hypothetical protein
MAASSKRRQYGQCTSCAQRMDHFTSPVELIEHFVGLFNKHQVAVRRCGLGLHGSKQQEASVQDNTAAGLFNEHQWQCGDAASACIHSTAGGSEQQRRQYKGDTPA